MRVLINGQPDATVDPWDRGLMYGDGVFRTLPVRDGQPVCWARHYPKLAHDCAALAIPCPPAETLREQIGLLTGDCALAVAKIVVTRGTGGRGYGCPAEPVPSVLLLRSDFPAYPPEFASRGVRLHLCRLRLAAQPALAGVKHLNRLENVLARREWSDPSIPEGLLLDPAGRPVEGTMSNLFAVSGNRLLTPKLDACGVAGVQRDRVIALAASFGLAVEICSMALSDMMSADAVFMTNSLIGLWPVRDFNGRQWDVAPLVHALAGRLAEDWE